MLFRAKKLDGAFFEEYAILHDKQGELVEKAAKGVSHVEVPQDETGVIFKPPDKKKVFLLVFYTM